MATNTKANTTNVLIMGQSYRLAIPDGQEDDLMRAVDVVNEAMCKIRDAGKIKARDRIAVLAALNIAFENLPQEPEEVLDEATVNQQWQEAQQRMDTLIDRLDEALVDGSQLL